jgi:hypothetical protein
MALRVRGGGTQAIATKTGGRMKNCGGFDNIRLNGCGVSRLIAEVLDCIKVRLGEA